MPHRECRPGLHRYQKLAAIAVAGGGVLLGSGHGLSAQVLKTDPVRGQALAARLCSNCHDTGTPAGARGQADAPSFRTIAGRGQSAEALAGKIIIPHPEMPTVPITIAEIRDVVGYIQSLKD